MATSVVLASAFGGAAITLVVTYYFRLRDESAVRVGALQVVQDDLKFARDTINACLKTDEVWPASYRLAPRAWRDYRGNLASQLSPATWAEIQNLATRLEVIDRWSNELRDRGINSDFRHELEDVRDRIGTATDKTSADDKTQSPSAVGEQPVADGQAPGKDDQTLGKSMQVPGPLLTKLGLAIKATRRGRTQIRILMFLLILGCVATTVALATSKPALTSTSLAQALKDATPGAQTSICDKNDNIEGDYICAVTFPTCTFAVDPPHARPSCSPRTVATYDVETAARCFSAAMSREVANGTPPSKPLSWLKKLLVLSNCAKA
ncbi:MAG TPA: hypothetical protein VIH71_10510 [Solirubrobacteraceae bacterium]